MLKKSTNQFLPILAFSIAVFFSGFTIAAFFLGSKISSLRKELRIEINNSSILQTKINEMKSTQASVKSITDADDSNISIHEDKTVAAIGPVTAAKHVETNKPPAANQQNIKPSKSTPATPNPITKRTEKATVVKARPLPVPMPMARQSTGMPTLKTSKAPNIKPTNEALEGKKIEALTAKNAGITKVSANSVTLNNEETIYVGDLFPSGEKLLFVDKENQHLITNQRQILILN